MGVVTGFIKKLVVSLAVRFRQWLPRIAKLFGFVSLKGVRKGLLFFTSGWKSYLALTFFVFLPLFDPLMLGPQVFLSALAEQVGTSYVSAVNGLAVVGGAGSAAAFLDGLFLFFEGLFSALWLLRGGRLVLNAVRPDMGLVLGVGIPAAFYAVLAWSFTGAVPILSDLSVIVGGLEGLSVNRFGSAVLSDVGLADAPNTTLNESVNRSVNATG